MNLLRTVLCGLLVALAGPVLAAEPAVDPAGPFVLGEAFPDHPATCDTLPDWADRAPDYDGRISMAIRGELQSSAFDGVLAVLVMCPAEQVQVVCVTYQPHDVVAGREIMLAGGFAGSGDGQVILDPCLAYDLPDG